MINRLDQLCMVKEKHSSHNIDACEYLQSDNMCTMPVPGGIAQSVGHLTCKSEVLGSIPGLATYFRFSFR